MSGRVLVDDEEAGDPLVYASNRRVPKWHRFGVHFADGGDFMLRDPRRLGAVELDPDESRLGPDAMTLSFAQLARMLAPSRAPIKAVLMDQHASPASATCSSTKRCGGPGIDPARPAVAIDADERRAAAQGDPHMLRTLDRRGGSHTGDMPRALDAPLPDATARRSLRRTVGGRTTYWCPVHQRLTAPWPSSV